MIFGVVRLRHLVRRSGVTLFSPVEQGHCRDGCLLATHSREPPGPTIAAAAIAFDRFRRAAVAFDPGWLRAPWKMRCRTTPAAEARRRARLGQSAATAKSRHFTAKPITAGPCAFRCPFGVRHAPFAIAPSITSPISPAWAGHGQGARRRCRHRSLRRDGSPRAEPDHRPDGCFSALHLATA